MIRSFSSLAAITIALELHTFHRTNALTECGLKSQRCYRVNRCYWRPRRRNRNRQIRFMDLEPALTLLKRSHPLMGVVALTSNEGRDLKMQSPFESVTPVTVWKTSVSVMSKSDRDATGFQIGALFPFE